MVMLNDGNKNINLHEIIFLHPIFSEGLDALKEICSKQKKKFTVSFKETTKSLNILVSLI